MIEAEKRILVADDEMPIVEGLKAMLEDEGYAIDTALDGETAFAMLMENDYPLLIVDLTIPKRDGIQLLESIKEKRLDTEVIIITGKGTVSTAVEAMRTGAYDYLLKPVAPDRLKSIIPKAIEHFTLKVSHRDLSEQLYQLTKYEDLIGKSDGMQAVYGLIDAVAPSMANVVITGESGTGKELVARAIHNKSGRAKKAFVAVNCSAFPRELLESELFGHERGAFTGAVDEKPGCFELAHEGTLFLDEIGEMSLDTQAKILRALEERRFRRLGGKVEIAVDVRVLAATNRDIRKAVDEKRLREDLYYRLCVVEIDLPPLRERPGDIPLLLSAFLEMYNRLNGKRIKGFSPACQEIILRYSWPGNVRELKNVVERAVVLCSKDFIDVHDLPGRITGQDSDVTNTIPIPLGTALRNAESKIILSTLEWAQNNKTRAAKILGISLKTLHNKLAAYKKK